MVEGHGLRRLQESWRHAERLPGTFSLQNILRENDLTSRLMYAPPPKAPFPYSTCQEWWGM